MSIPLQPYARKMVFAGKNKGVKELLQVIAEKAFDISITDDIFRLYICAILEKKGMVCEKDKFEEVGEQKRIGFAPDVIGNLDFEL